MTAPQVSSWLAAGSALLGGCAALDAMTGSWHAPGEGPRAHVLVARAANAEGVLYFCAAGGWREVDEDTDVPAGQALKLRSLAQPASHVRHGVEHPERECVENLQFRPEDGATYSIAWNPQASNCAVIIFRKPAGAAAGPASDWPYEDSAVQSDGLCGPNKH